jgi:hypothetical protein
MRWFSPIEKQCRETPVSSRPLETSFQWDGYVKNGFGMEVITWKGVVTYSYQNGKLLTADPCANRSCLNTESVYLWEADNDATSVTTRTIANAKPEEAILAYQIIA